jgi:hypothetical protein
LENLELWNWFLTFLKLRLHLLLCTYSPIHFVILIRFWEVGTYFAMIGLPEKKQIETFKTSKVWVFWESQKIWRKSSSYFWQERRVLCAQQRTGTCQKVDEDFSKQMWSSRMYYTNFNIKWHQHVNQLILECHFLCIQISQKTNQFFFQDFCPSL